jgi:hypothetical protein
MIQLYTYQMEKHMEKTQFQVDGCKQLKYKKNRDTVQWNVWK